VVDVDLDVQLTRTQLGLGYLNINDHVNYAIAPGSFGAQVTWQRNQVGSIYQDDEITTYRKRNKVMENIIVEVFGDNNVEVQGNVDALIAAVLQSNFDILISVNGVYRVYACETADYGMKWEGNRFVANQFQVNLTVPRSPVPKVGVL